MAYDVVLIQKSTDVELFARKLGFTKIIFQNEMKNLKILYIPDYNKKRQAVERKQVNILLNPHLITSKDSLHYRRSGLDQVLCSMMHNNNIAMAFTFDSMNNHIEIGRVMQNITLCRKYKVKVLFFTFAKNMYELRARLDIIAFLETLGMTPSEAKFALEGLKEIC